MKFASFASHRGEIATTLTLIGLSVMAVGTIVGSLLAPDSMQYRSQAAACPFSFGAPEFVRLGDTYLCYVPILSGSDPKVSCALAQNNRWVSTSSYFGKSGTSEAFEIHLLPGHGDGDYQLVAYEFDTTCEHPDQAATIQIVSVSPPTATPPPLLSPTTSFPSATPLPTATPLPSPTAAVASPTPLILHTPTIIPSTRTAATPVVINETTPAPQVALQSVRCTGPVQTIKERNQTWVYRTGADGKLEVVPAAGQADQMQLITTYCVE